MLGVVAILANLGLFAAGVAIELRPRFRSDVWAGAAIAALAIVNLLALRSGPRPAAGLRRRLRRIALLSNRALLLLALVLLGGLLVQLRTSPLELVATLLLPAAPALTLAALRASADPSGAPPSRRGGAGNG